MRIIRVALLGIALGTAASADPGDAEKAKAMLGRVVVAVEQDQDAAMQRFNAGADGFKDGSIYPFCFRLADGIVINGQTAGKDIRTFPGSGQQIFDAAHKAGGVVTDIAYMARRPPPADATLVPKVSVVRRIGKIGCGVGYYP